VVEHRLTPAFDEGLLVMEPGPDPAVRFRHDRAREAILAGLGPPRQQALRLAIARRLAAVPELFAAAAEQYLPVAGAVEDAAERRQVAGLPRRAAFVAVAMRGDYAAGNRAIRRILAVGEARGYEPGTSQALPARRPGLLVRAAGRRGGACPGPGHYPASRPAW
jgi:hypothetical protein